MNSSKENLKHTKWECKYHVVFIPKYRSKVMYGSIRKELGLMMRELARHKESGVEEGHLMGDHVHMMLSIPPKYAVHKSSLRLCRKYMTNRVRDDHLVP